MSRSRVASLVTLSAMVVAAATLAATTSMPMLTPSAGEASQVQEPGNGVTLPQVLHEVKPVYTPQAMQQKIQGSVWLRIVVLANGNVGDVEVTRSLDQEFGLDNQAIAAARQWRFKPGTKDSKPVAVRVTLELTFTLK